ncbi:MAG: hypothetical protein IT336_09520 [Thermomicrobiales bacterium]|nr:hypothetical protein [Thermomicrobiales bacterium]
MSESEQVTPAPAPEMNAGGDQTRGKSKRGSGKRGGRPQAEGADSQRQSRPRVDRAMAGFGDGIERAICMAVTARPPVASPVQHRTGVATSRFVEIARSGSTWLYCNGEHFGPCLWPNGDVVPVPAESRQEPD